ncbi:DUF58 domain-containing protein [Microbacterium paraoxydans]|uniref:DUF58 domain-containing protein n=1 Tax=Microbacterium paraoxydans TaxID=199592 RepID=UPI003013C6B0
MTDEAAAQTVTAVAWRRTPVLALGIGGAAIIAAVGLAFSRPDVVAVGLPLALTAAWALLRRPSPGEARIALRAHAAGSVDRPEVRTAADVALAADAVQIAVDQDGRRTGLADVRPGTACLTARGVLQHSGPSEPLAVTLRGSSLDGAWVSDIVPRTAIAWNAPPRAVRIGSLPVAPRLTGLHGSHAGSRPGQGGDFRDIQPFVPGDELRRVDWRATARAARRPGDLLVRRDDALSDSSVVLAIDTAEDLGAAVAAWGSGDPDRSGATSLDLAREAALAIATAAIGLGDRVAYHALSPDGLSLPAGGGARHLARLRRAIAATGIGTEPSYRRSPAVPPGSIVFVLSTFVDGVAARLAMSWRAAGHAVIAVDVLPAPEETRLSREQRVALRTLLAERTDVLAELRHAGLEVVPCSGGVDAAMRLAARRLARRGTGRR